MAKLGKVTTSAHLVEEWRNVVVPRVVEAVGRSAGTSRALGIGAFTYTTNDSNHTDEHEKRPGLGHSDVNSPVNAPLFTPPPELLFGLSLVGLGERTVEGVIIGAIRPAWRRFLGELSNNPEALYQLDPRQFEELVAGAYREEGWRVTLTPRSGDRGRDIIAEREDIGAIRVLDQVKLYAPEHTVPANDVRALYGVLSLDQRASKAIITTSSRFAPGAYQEFAALTPSRLELRDGTKLLAWLGHAFTKRLTDP